jgi:hypothetical protein
MVMGFYQIGIIEILPLLLQNCLPFGSTDFTASARRRSFAVVHYPPPYFGGHALRLAYAANSTLAKFRY